jgi:hypothetical protein
MKTVNTKLRESILNEALECFKATQQIATIWKIDEFAHWEIHQQFTGTQYLRQIGLATFEFLGIELVAFNKLPKGRIVLKAGENSVGAFSIQTDCGEADE